MNITDTKEYYFTSNIKNDNKDVILLNGEMKSNIKFNIPNFLEYDKNVIYRTIKINHCEIPYSFYIINNNNNKIIINNITFTIEIGNYNAYTLKEYINNLLVENSINAELELNTSNGKFKLISNTFISINSSTSYKIFGLDKNTNYNGIFNNIDNKYYINFSYPCDTSGISNIHIKTNIMTKNLNVYNNDSHILKSISVNVSPFGIINYMNSNSSNEFIIRNRETDYLQIQLLDNEGNFIDFNNIDWFLCIEIKSIKEFKNDNFDDFLTFNN